MILDDKSSQAVDQKQSTEEEIAPEILPSESNSIAPSENVDLQHVIFYESPLPSVARALPSVPPVQSFDDENIPLLGEEHNQFDWEKVVDWEQEHTIEK